MKIPFFATLFARRIALRSIIMSPEVIRVAAKKLEQVADLAEAQKKNAEAEAKGEKEEVQSDGRGQQERERKRERGRRKQGREQRLYRFKTDRQRRRRYSDNADPRGDEGGWERAG